MLFFIIHPRRFVAVFREAELNTPQEALESFLSACTGDLRLAQIWKAQRLSLALCAFFGILVNGVMYQAVVAAHGAGSAPLFNLRLVVP